MQRRHPGLKVLVVSGSWRHHERLASQQKEGEFPAVAACLKKPFTPDELIERVRHLAGF